MDSAPEAAPSVRVFTGANGKARRHIETAAQDCVGKAGCLAPGKVWLDDRRGPPNGDWVWVTTPAETIVILELDEVEKLNLGYDLGVVMPDGDEQTGYDVLRRMEKQVAIAGLMPPKLAVHSANPQAHERMQRAIDSINRRVGRSKSG
jgi:hypothetical protein